MIAIPTNNNHLEGIWFDELDVDLGEPLGQAYQINANDADILSGDGDFSAGIDNWTLNIVAGSATKEAVSTACKINITKRPASEYDIKLEYPNLAYSPGRYTLTLWAKSSNRIPSLNGSFGGISGAV
jgi:hypothetical protein